MTHDIKQQWGAAKVLILAVMLIVAFSFMSNEVVGTKDSAVIGGHTIGADTISHWDMPMDSVDAKPAMAIATDGEDHSDELDADGWPVRHYVDKNTWDGDHIKGRKAKRRFEKRKAKIMKDFVDTMGRKAVEMSLYFSKNKGVDIPPSVIMAAAINEARFGTSRLAVLGHNYFGVQYRGKRKGIVGSMPAKDQDYKGETKTYSFAKYASPWWGLYHYADLIKRGYAHRLVKGDIALRDQYFGALCGCDDTRMLASDATEERVSGGHYYAAACENTASDEKTALYVASMRWAVRAYKLHKLDEQWMKLKRRSK